VVRSDGVRYASIGEAVEAVNGKWRAIKNACVTGDAYLGFGWAYAAMIGVSPRSLSAEAA
jgi:hypothetical protein